NLDRAARAQRPRQGIEMTEKSGPSGDFSHIEAWVFDLDNTLYPSDCNLFAEIDTRMGDFIAARFGVSLEEAQRMPKSLFLQIRPPPPGLMRLHDVCPNAFLDYVHD